jgi:prefoldin alpha subunit
MDQEAIMKIQMMEQETNQLNEQLKMVDQNVIEMKDLKASLDEIDSNENKEIMANLGKRIFIPVDIREKSLIVEVGNGNFVKKSVPDTKKIVDEEGDKLMEAKNQIMGRLDELQNDMNKMIMEFQKAQMDAQMKNAKEGQKEDESTGHVHGPDCNHDHEDKGTSKEDKKKEDSIEDLAEGK